MYVPRQFEQTSVKAMHELMRANPFATLITLGDGGPCANHLPMVLTEARAPYGLLSAHVPRVNSLSREALIETAALVIFQGPNAYITPSWYASKRETGRVVPTWNYLAVHVHGQIRVVDDSGWLETHLDQLTRLQEAAFPNPWSVSDAPKEYTGQLASQLVGIEVTIDKLVGKWKLSQNRSVADRAGVAAGLRSLGRDSTTVQMADWVESIEPRKRD